MSGPTPAIGDTKVMDWVEQQALGDGIETIVGDVNKAPYQQQTANPEGRVYDIQTLLDICAATDLSNIHLRIHQGALHGMSKSSFVVSIKVYGLLDYVDFICAEVPVRLAFDLFGTIDTSRRPVKLPVAKTKFYATENVFKTTNVLPASRRHIRSRGLSEVSRPSIGSDEEDVLLVGRLSYPVRQPHAAPKSMAAQNQGFRHMAIRQPNRPPPNMIGARVEGFLSFPQKLPSRQPNSPPRQPFSSSSELAQQHAGFQRFLKEHASPPHQRVTAGGRIVPANGPPPVFNVNSLTGTIKSPPRSATGATSRTGNFNDASKAAENASGPRFVSAASRHGIVVSEASEISGNTQPFAPTEKVTSQNLQQDANLQTQTQDSIQYPYNPAPIMLLQDGTTFVMQNGLPYRVYSNGLQTFTEAAPLLYAQQTPSLGFPSASIFQQSVSTQPNHALPYEDIQDPSVNGDSILNSYKLHSRQGSSEQTLQHQHTYLRNELQSLDRYIALHGKKFGRHEHLAFVALRKQLVQELDQYRRRLSRASSSETRNQLYQYTSLGAQSSTNQSADRAGVPVSYGSSVTGQGRPPFSAESRTSAPLKIDDSGKNQPMPGVFSNNGVNQLKTPSVKSSAGTSRILSPEAPPFVPGQLRKTSARKVESCIPDNESKDAFSNTQALSSPRDASVPVGNGRSPPQMPKAEIVQSKHSPSYAVGTGQGRLSHARYGTSGSWSAMEALAPDVHQKDIAYVDEMGLNTAYGVKKYCSTVLEFQEVIRRVREQARLYGCKGGSSKDPEFDAEQDIRWALSDSTPVPLPKKIPDHIAYPRPWCWNDSTFNIHADRSDLRNTSPAKEQHTMNFSGAQISNIDLNDPKAQSHETTPRSTGYRSTRSPAAGRNDVRSTVFDNDASPSAHEISFQSSRQAAILRETRSVLGNLPSNSLTRNSGSKDQYNRPKTVLASPSRPRTDEASLKDPFQSFEPAGELDQDAASINASPGKGPLSLANASPQSKLIVKLPYAQASKNLLVVKDSNAKSEARAGSRDLPVNDQHQSVSTQSSSIGFGTSSFLGKLLRSPLFSSANPKKSGPSKLMGGRSASNAQGTTDTTQKENLKSEHGVYNMDHPTYPRQVSIGFHQDNSFGKSLSSVAPTNTNAHAQMHPQPSRPGGPFQSSEWQIRHHPPSPAHSIHGPSTRMYQQRGMPQYDGADEESPRGSNVPTNEPENDGKKAGRKELDPREFQTGGNELPGGHEYAVNRFLENVKKAEDKDKAKHPPKNNK